MSLRSIRRARGFTLLELLVVVAILAIIAGGMIVAYEGLEGRAADSTIAFNIKGVDQAIRQFTSIERTSPNVFDSLMYSDDDSGTDAEYLNLVDAELISHLGTLTASSLTAADVDALADAGITNVLFVSGDAGGYDNSTPSTTAPEIPNRVFDPILAGGYGINVALTAGVRVPTVADTELLYHAAKLPMNQTHRVVALGVGNNSTLVGTASSVSMSEAPFSGEVRRNQYGRFIALYLLATDGNYLEKARFVGVIDPSGHHLDAAYASATGQHAD